MAFLPQEKQRCTIAGGSDVPTDWRTKTVLVEASATTPKELMLKKLQKVRRTDQKQNDASQ